MAARFSDDATLPIENCLICTEILTDPKSLPCRHRFCSSCLEKVYHSTQRNVSGDAEVATTTDSLTCPVCRREASASDLGLVRKDSAPVLDAVEEMVNKITSPKRPNCDVCRYKNVETPAKDHCPTCAIDFCTACKRDHDRHSTVFRSHSAVPVAQRDKSSLKCEMHRAEVVRYFCTTCLAPLCAVCAVTEHNRHDTAELNVALGNKKEKIEGRIFGMTEKVSRHEDMLAKFEDLQSIKEAAVKKTRLEIERHIGTLVSVLHQRRQTLIDELDKYHTASTKAINIEKDHVMLQLANMKSLWKFAAKLTEPSQAIQLLASYSEIDRMVDGLVNASDPRLPREATTMMMFLPKESLAVGELQTCEMSSQLLQRIEARSMNGGGASGYESPRASSPDPRRAVSPSPWRTGCVADVRGERMKIKYLQGARLVWKADKIGQRVGEINEAYDVTITPNGTVIVAEWLNQRLQVFDSTGYSKELIGQNLIQPWGVTLTRDNLLAVTDEKDRTVKLFSMGSSASSASSPTSPSGATSPLGVGSLVSSWKKQAFGWPRGIVANRAGQLIVTDTQHGRHTVSIHLPDGQCIRQCGSQGSGNEQFHWPRYVAVDLWDRILVADSSNHCVKVLDPTGQYMFKFGSAGAGDGHMRHPRGICSDPNGGIVIADQDNNRVTLYDEDGKFVRHLISISKPWGVALSEGGLLAVTHKQSLSLYKVFDPLP